MRWCRDPAHLRRLHATNGSEALLAPMTSPDLIHMLWQAMHRGASIRLVCRGGDRSGVERSIRPVRLSTDRLCARVAGFPDERCYLLHKIDLDAEGSGVEFHPERRDTRDSTLSVGATFTAVRPQFERLGWHVHLERDAIGLYRRLRDARAHTAADVGIIHEHPRRPVRPYYCYGPSLTSARTFARLAGAADWLTLEAVKHAPGRREAPRP